MEVCKAVVHAYPNLRDRMVHSGRSSSLPYVSDSSFSIYIAIGLVL
jgi:hypothetical protein